ncbi:hypothetical protein NQ318_003422 [Aromia moschata]|uniref:THAP-type domain-containing protein n=1 Tax=Aromia moschata TaxID=1265417 RepID=A0AAV8YUX0_9CUCU|nr:hypothetical protein NQ318_003422 [Aromia moschata]
MNKTLKKGNQKWEGADALIKCKNTTKKPRENVHFFHYPIKHKERCKIWNENANKPYFCDSEEEKLWNKVIHEYHFEDRWLLASVKRNVCCKAQYPAIDAGAREIESYLHPPETPAYVLPQLQDVQVLSSQRGRYFIRPGY